MYSNLVTYFKVLGRLQNLKQQLQIFIISETDGARIRSRQNWVEHGEKCTKFFLNLEKQRSNSNTIFSVIGKNSNTNYTNPTEILTEITVYHS